MPSDSAREASADLLLVVGRLLLERVDSGALSDDIAIRRGLLLADLAFETFAKAALRYSMQANAVGGGFARRG